MLEKIRTLLSWGHKPMGLPDIQKQRISSRYIRAVWQRVGGVWQTGEQSKVATVLGLSLSTLKRYMSTDGACPYSVQFSLEHLAGMNDAGRLYKIDSEIGQFLQPFAASGSMQMGDAWITYIVLTQSELDQLSKLAEQENIKMQVTNADN